MCETEEQAEKTALKQMLHPSVTNTQWLSLVRKKKEVTFVLHILQTAKSKDMAYNGIKITLNKNNQNDKILRYKSS